MEVDSHQPSSDGSRPVATGPDAPRQVAPEADDYISLREAREIFLAHGRPVSERTLQRSCGKGHLTGKKIATAEGEKWFALKSSVLHRIAELDKFDELRERHDAIGRDASRHVAEENQRFTERDAHRRASTPDVTELVVPAEVSHPTPSATSRHDATGRDASAELARIEELYGQLLAAYKEQTEDLRKDKTTLQADKEALLAQLTTKDRQIERFFSSERDTKTLFGTLQSLVASILPGKQGGERYAPVREAIESGLPENQPEER